MTLQANPIEPESYLVQKQLLAKTLAEPEFAKTLNNNSTNFFPANDVMYHIYQSVLLMYRANGFSAPVGQEALRIRVAEKLDSMNADVNTRGQYDYIMNDVYTTISESMGTNLEDTTNIVMEHVRTLSVTDSMKRAIAKDLSPTAISNLINEIHTIEGQTIHSVIPEPINVLSPDTMKQQAEAIRDLLTSRVPTPFEAYNLATGGGIASGEMACVAGKSGTGKTLHMNSLAIGYAMQGLDVVYFALEELESRMYHRMYKAVIDHIIQRDSTLNEEQVRELTTLKNTAEYIDNGVYAQLIDSLRTSFNVNIGNLYLMKYKPYELTIEGLHSAMNKLTVIKGLNIDAMFIDYPDLMEYDKSLGESESGGRLFAQIRGVGQTFETITWVASQLNRGTGIADVYTETHIEGSYRKQNALEALVVINQKPEEYKAGFTRIYIGKARNSLHRGELLQLTVNKITANLRDQTALEASRHATILENLGSKTSGSPQQDMERANKLENKLENVTTHESMQTADSIQAKRS